MVSQSSQKQEFKAQHNLVKKLELYLNYLIQVKFMSSWRPHQNVQDIRRLQDDDHKFSGPITKFVDSKKLGSELRFGMSTWKACAIFVFLSFADFLPSGSQSVR